MPDVFAVAGLIGIRWREWGGADGPFGAALSGEDPIPGTAGRRQRFERGEMVWAPEQDMLVSAFRLRNVTGSPMTGRRRASTQRTAAALR
jgi:uncharacterized protein with LGFP repeats